MTLLRRIMSQPGGISFSRRRFFGITVAYAATGDITEINPSTVTYQTDHFRVPVGTTSFTFTDDGDNKIAEWDGSVWNINITSESYTDGDTIMTVRVQGGDLQVYDETSEIIVASWGYVYVSYTPTTTVSNIEPVTVTWEANEFSVPSSVIEFSFDDDGKTWVFKYEDGEWNLYEHVEY